MCTRDAQKPRTNPYVPESNDRAQAGKEATVMQRGESLGPGQGGNGKFRGGRGAPAYLGGK